MNKYELKPCPFCGEIPVFDTDGHYTYVLCWHCGSRGKRIMSSRSAQKQAAEAWNRREGECQDGQNYSPD